jgi:hypothetical protein
MHQHCNVPVGAQGRDLESNWKPVKPHDHDTNLLQLLNLGFFGICRFIYEEIPMFWEETNYNCI